VQKVRIILPFSTSFLDYADNESLAIIVYIMGREHKCKGCHNPQFSDFNYKNSYLINEKEFTKLIEDVSKKHRTNKIVFEGGDPLHPQNIKFTKNILRKLKHLNFMIYTGYDINYVKENKVNGFKFLKCGKYVEEKKQESRKTDFKFFLASKNQKIFDSELNLLSENGVLNFITGDKGNV